MCVFRGQFYVNIKRVEWKIRTLTLSLYLSTRPLVLSETFRACFGFIVTLNDKPASRHRLLVALSNVYYPLGLGAPFLLKIRLIIQGLCKDNLKWYEPVDEKSPYELFKWRNNLMMLDGKSIARCVKPKNFENVTSFVLHHLSPVNDTGYGQSSYVRLVKHMH